MSSSSEKSNSPAKPVRRRANRRTSQLCDINAVEIRRQIFQALQLHRASSSSSSSSSSPSSSSSSSSSASSSHVVVGSQFNSLVESMPLPGPVWSTTAPSVLAHAPSAAATTMEALEFEWGENQASSYSWWLSFLNTLDSNSAEKSKYHLPLGSSNWLFGQNQNSCKALDQEPSLVDANDQSPSPDEWLMLPTTEDDGEVEIP